MDNKELVDLAESLEILGMSSKDAFKVVGSKVAKEFSRGF